MMIVLMTMNERSRHYWYKTMEMSIEYLRLHKDSDI